MTTTDQLAAIEARADAATEGPWKVVRHDLSVYVESRYANLQANLGYVGNHPEPDAVFIAHAREDIPALLALVREQQAQIERVEAVHHEGVAYADDIAEGGDEEVPEDYERRYCNEDGENWPCMTIAALTATEGA